MKDFNTIASFNNPKIKTVVISQTVLLATGNYGVAFNNSVNVDDKNIIPVALRVTLVFPDAVTHAIGNSFVGGAHLTAKARVDDGITEGGVLVYPQCGSEAAPKYEQEFYGASAKPLSNIAIFSLSGWVSVMRGVFTHNIVTRVFAEFFYIPIRY